MILSSLLNIIQTGFIYYSFKVIGGPSLETHRITQSLETQVGGTAAHLGAGITLANRYLIQEIVGVGGMGAVYRARDLHFPKLIKLVAVKEMINPVTDAAVRQTVVNNFEREANILATLNHPAIPRILDYFTQGERSYLVMEFINGKNLEELVNDKAGPLPEAQVLGWSIELCDVLEYLHKRKPESVIFRDMKPSNIMVNQHDHLMLVDFGIAKHFQTGQRGTQVGTEGYSPPEQYRGDATPLADIYALGATMHHLLTYRDPRLDAPFSFAERPIRSINPEVTLELEAVVSTALQYNLEDRFNNAAAMKEALLTVANRTGVMTRASLATGTIHPESGSVKPLWVFGCEDEIRGSPTFHKGVLYVGCYDNNLYALDAADGTFKWKFATDGGVVSQPIIQDTKVIVGSEDGRLYALSTRSGKLVWTYYTQGPVRSSPRIAEGHVFVGSDDAFLHAVNIQSARQAWKVDAGSAVRSTPYVTDEFVYFGTEEGDFFCLDFGGTEKWRFRAKRGITSSPTFGENAVYFTSLDWTLYSLDATAGWVLWRFRLGKPSISSPVIIDKHVIVGAIDGNIYCVDANSGKEVWRFKTEHQVNGSASIYKDVIYIGSVDGNLYCIDYKTGRLRWKFSTEGPITGKPFIFDDIVYLGSADHNVYALLA